MLAFNAPAAGFVVPNDYVAEYVARDPARLVGFGAVDPHDAGAVDELERFRDLGLAGCKLGSDLPGRRSALADEFLAVCAALERLELPMLIHQGTTFSRAGSLLQARPALLDAIALRHPRLKIVIAHMGHPWFDDAIQVVRRHPNVYADVSALVSRRWLLYQALVAAAEYGVTHKLLFGTDFPFFTARQTIDGLRSVDGRRVRPRHARDRRADRGGHRPPPGPRATGDQMTQAEKGAAFAALHEGEPFVIPNPWDAGSARVLEALGFRALATTSSGFAFTLGRLDGGDDARRGRRARGRARRRDGAAGLGRPRERLRRRRRRTPRTRSRASPRPERSAARSRTGIPTGGSTSRPTPPSASQRRPRRRAALGFPFLLTGARREPHPRQPGPRGHDRAPPGLRGRRCGRALRAGPRARSTRSAPSATPSSKPVNVLALPDLTMAEIVGAGAQRISVGGALTWVAMKAFADAAVALRDEGDLSALGARLPLGEWLAG